MARPADPNAKEALMAAARAEFARRGLRGARIEDITAACGLSKGAFYLHFESKEALFVGTYLLLAVRMSRLQEKPDLREWARSLHTLVHEGSQPSAQTNFQNPDSPERSKP